MDILKTKEEARNKVRKWQNDADSVGFVPTMGALHQGHMSLIKASLSECPRTVVSIFLNPTQFEEKEDLARYPKQLKEDRGLLEKAGVDMVFEPDTAEMYSERFCTWVVQERTTDKLCGHFRPGHFKGVCTVVAKLFGIIPAQNAYFGRKDYQQSVIIKNMVRDLDIPVNIRIMPTVREKDGLALSSRNSYLTPEQRTTAACLHETLLAARAAYRSGLKDVNNLIQIMLDRLKQNAGIKPEYVEIALPDSLERPETASSDSICAIAVRIGKTRLIDNMPLGGDNNDIYLQ